MSDKRIIQLTETQTIAADDYVPVDGATGGTKKFLASNLGGKAEVMTEAEWDDLPDSKLTDGKVYALSGVSPSTQDNLLWQKLGFAALDTEADDCSDAINELNTGLTTLNSRLGSCGMIAYSNTVTIPANSSKEFDLSSLVPSGATLHAISNVSLGGYALPYAENGVIKTYLYAFNPVSKRFTIQNNTSAWTNYDIRFVIFYTTS